MHQKTWMYLPLLALLTGLAGCGGSSSGGGEKISSLDSAAPCINCHTNATSPGTGQPVVVEWKQSAHATAIGASCRDCHEPAAGHPSSCDKCHTGTAKPAEDELVRNPDAAGKCGKCHTAAIISPNGTLSYKAYSSTTLKGFKDAYAAGTGRYINDRKAHFGNPKEASFVSSKYVNNCRQCHNPHDPTSAMKYSMDYARSAHGTTPEMFDASGELAVNTIRFETRDRDFKTFASMDPAADVASDGTWSQNAIDIDASGNYIGPGSSAVCIRCHTTTGFIQFVSPDPSNGNKRFSNLRPFADRAENIRQHDKLVALNKKNPANPAPPSVGIFLDPTAEVQACNMCHDDGAAGDSARAYNFKKIRQVGQVTTHYNFAGKPLTTAQKTAGHVQLGKDKMVKYDVTYPDLGDANVCISCHSGREVAMVIKLADAENFNFGGLTGAAISPIMSHFRPAAQLLFQSGGFEFYTSAAKYTNPIFSHPYIGRNIVTPIGTGPYAGDKRGKGPCIGCHMRNNGTDKAGETTHTFLPVNANAGATYLAMGNPYDWLFAGEKITNITAIDTCADCHKGAYAWTAEKLNEEKEQYKAALMVFQAIVSFTLDNRAARSWFDIEMRPVRPSNWYAGNLQKWLRSSQPVPGTPFTPGTQARYADGTPMQFIGPKGTRFEGQVLGLSKAAVTMGAEANYMMMYYDPGAFAHNSAYVKRLIFDSIQWLINGNGHDSLDPNDAANDRFYSVKDILCSAPVQTASGTWVCGSEDLNDATGRPTKKIFGASATPANKGTTSDYFLIHQVLSNSSYSDLISKNPADPADSADKVRNRAFRYLFSSTGGTRP